MHDFDFTSKNTIPNLFVHILGTQDFRNCSMVHLPGCSRGCSARCPSAWSTPWSSSRPAKSSTSWKAVYMYEEEGKKCKMSKFRLFRFCRSIVQLLARLFWHVRVLNEKNKTFSRSQLSFMKAYMAFRQRKYCQITSVYSNWSLSTVFNSYSTDDN